jgi:hypothetical protein
MGSRIVVERNPRTTEPPTLTMESTNRLIKTGNWEAFLQVCQLGFGLTMVAILILIDSDIQRLVDCLLNKPIDRTYLAPPPINCTSLDIQYDLKIRVDVCEPAVVAIYVNNSVLRSYSGQNATDLVDWLSRCYRTNYLRACPVFSTVTCPHFISHSDAGICYYNHQFAYFVISGFRFSRRESLDLIRFITSAMRDTR